MSDFPDAAAEIIQGAATARAVEPHAGEGREGGHVCLNCGAQLIGRHCHECGQSAHVHRSLSGFFHDLLHGVFHFEGKIWHTLPLLAWKPGQLTREYVEGRRARYVSPIALFLFVVFLTFATYSLIGGAPDMTAKSPDGVVTDLSAAADEAAADIAEIQADLDKARTEGLPTATLERKLKEAQDLAALLNRAQTDPAAALADQLAGGSGAGTAGNSASSPGWLGSTWQKVRDNPSLIAYKLQANAYKFSWLLIPISVPFVWLLFPFSRNFRLYDHTIFVTYSISFMLMLILLTAWLGRAPIVAEGAGLPMLYAPFHLYKHVKGAYRLGVASALIRTILLGIFALVALLLFGLALVAMAIG